MIGGAVPADRDTQLALRVLQAQAGDRSALDRVLRRAQGRLLTYLERLLGERHSAEDVLQEVLLLICRNLRWLADPRLFDAWVYRIATRAAFRQRGGAPRMLPLEIAAERRAAPAPADFEERELPAVRTAVAELPLNHRAVLVLHYYEGLRLGDVAAFLDVPLGTVKSRLGAALTTLRARLGLETPT
jgi:RNA polymerase sigma-70 factor (ECF subfamily)